MLPKDPQKALEYRKRLSDLRKGIKFSPETLKRMSEAGKVRKMRPMSEEHKRKISEAQKGKSRPYCTGKKRPDLTARLLTNNPNKGKFGKEHPCFKENKKHPFHKLIRETYKYREWRKTIFERDSYFCVLCENTGYVEADHYPIRFIDIIRKFGIDTLEKAIECEPLWNTNNGRTLCRKCHRKTPTWGRRLDTKQKHGLK